MIYSSYKFHIYWIPRHPMHWISINMSCRWRAACAASENLRLHRRTTWYQVWCDTLGGLLAREGSGSSWTVSNGHVIWVMGMCMRNTVGIWYYRKPFMYIYIYVYIYVYIYICEELRGYTGIMHINSDSPILDHNGHPRKEPKSTMNI